MLHGPVDLAAAHAGQPAGPPERPHQLSRRRRHAAAPAPGDRTPWAAWAPFWALYAAFVVYGSLVPLEFQPLPLGDAWARFRATPFLTLGVESRADWVANGVLYVPMGLLGARALAGWGRVAGGGAALGLAVLVAFAVEFTQLFFPPRTVSQNDLIAETIGATLGVLAAGALTPWLARWRAAWARDAALILTLALCAYALLYLLYALFPYDVLLSRAELAAKLASPMWGVVLAQPDGFSWLRATLLWGVELALAVPLGVLLACWVPPRRAVPVALGVGVVLGLALELAQLLIASGVTQGVSVLSRALGLAAGAWALNAWRPDSPARLRELVRRWAPAAVPVWLLLLLAAAGWMRHEWGGLDRVLQSWGELRFLPFYYHYWTTEAIALTSLATTVVMYSPLALLAWATRTPARGMAWVTAALAVGVEAGKLPWLVIRPDPTNVLIAVASVVLLTVALRRIEQGWGRAPAAPGVAPTASPAAPPTTASTAASTAASIAPPPGATPSAAPPLPSAAPARTAVGRGTRALCLGVLAAVALVAWGWPVAPLLLLLGLAMAFGATAWRPAWLLVIVPAAWPVLDGGTWTGRLFVDEFDLVLAAALAGAVWRLGLPRRGDAGGWPWSVVLFGLSVTVSALWALRAWDGPDPNQFAHLHSPFNGLRIAKGAFWALALTLVVRRLDLQPAALVAGLGRGVALGLALTVAWVVWERAAMAGLLDFDAEYRVTGPFSIMNKGGAYIECYLAVAAALLLAWGRRWSAAPGPAASGPWTLPGGAVTLALLLAGTAYAVMVTYSRNGYAALAAGLGVALALGVLQSRGARGRAAVLAIGVTVLVGAVAAPVLAGAFARDRLASTVDDFQVRWSHWAAALSLREEGLLPTVLGMGTGTFPVTHYWHSRAERRAASWRLEPGNGNPFVRIGPGATVYFEQIVDVDPARPLTLTMNVHSATGAPRLELSWCRKTTLTSLDCQGAEVKGIVAPGLWQTQDAELPALPAPRNLAARAVPLKLALHTPADGPVVDIDNVSLFVKDAVGPERGINLLHNGSFAKGLDRWHWSTNVDPPWHIHSLPVGVLFDQGWAGVLALALLVTTALLRGLRRVLDGRPLALAGVAGIVAFLVSGSLNTLIDEPRFLMLFLLLAGLAAGPRAAGTDR